MTDGMTDAPSQFTDPGLALTVRWSFNTGFLGKQTGFEQVVKVEPLWCTQCLRRDGRVSISSPHEGPCEKMEEEWFSAGLGSTGL